MLTIKQSTFQSVSSSFAPAVSQAPHCSNGYKVVTTFNQRGFKTVETVPVGVSTKFDDKGLPVTVYPPNCQITNIPLKVAAIMGVTQTNGGAEPTAQASVLPSNLGVYLQEKQSGGSTVSARWFAVVGTSMAAMMFAIFLA